MSTNKISLNVVMDASGSMAPLKNDTIKGFNGFLEEQRQLPGEATLTLCIFNTRSTLLFESEEIKSIRNLTEKDYNPSGGTALLDAIGKTIDSTEKKIAAMKEEDRPSKVLFMIITDGEENSSSSYKIKAVKEMVTKHQQEAAPWEFVFVGAQGIDAISVGGAFGVAANNAVMYSADVIGTNHMYESMTRGTTKYRSEANAVFDASVFNPGRK